MLAISRVAVPAVAALRELGATFCMRDPSALSTALDWHCAIFFSLRVANHQHTRHCCVCPCNVHNKVSLFVTAIRRSAALLKAVEARPLPRGNLQRAAIFSVVPFSAAVEALPLALAFPVLVAFSAKYLSTFGFAVAKPERSVKSLACYISVGKLRELILLWAGPFRNTTNLSTW